MNSQSQLIVQHKWQCLNGNNLPRDYTIHFIWIHLNEQITFQNELNLTDLISNSGVLIKNKLLSFSLAAPMKRPMKSGAWRLLLILNNSKMNSMNRIGTKLIKSDSGHIDIEKLNNLKMKNNSKDSLNELLNNLDISKQSSIIGETEFLILPSYQTRAGEEQLDNLKHFWKIKDICVNELNNQIDLSLNECSLAIKQCLNTSWSASLPDPKSEFVIY